jgi:hypothetical protein
LTRNCGKNEISGGKGYDIAHIGGSIDDVSMSLKGNSVMVEDSREGMAGSGSGRDTLDGIEATFFAESDITQDLTGAEAPLLRDDQITADGEGQLQISSDQLMSNDLDLFEAIADISVSGTSASRGGGGGFSSTGTLMFSMLAVSSSIWRRAKHTKTVVPIP